MPGGVFRAGKTPKYPEDNGGFIAGESIHELVSSRNLLHGYMAMEVVAEFDDLPIR